MRSREDRQQLFITTCHRFSARTQSTDGILMTKVAKSSKSIFRLNLLVYFLIPQHEVSTDGSFLQRQSSHCGLDAGVDKQLLLLWICCVAEHTKTGKVSLPLLLDRLLYSKGYGSYPSQPFNKTDLSLSPGQSSSMYK